MVSFTRMKVYCLRRLDCYSMGFRTFWVQAWRVSAEENIKKNFLPGEITKIHARQSLNSS